MIDWGREGFEFECRFPGEYDLWLNRKTYQYLRRYADGRDWLKDQTTGEYVLVTDAVVCRPLSEAWVLGDELHIDLWYPGLAETQIKKFVIGLTDVRAADNIRVSYDKQRDGWKIEQASVFEWESGDTVCDPDWQEVAFIQAWGRDERG